MTAVLKRASSAQLPLSRRTLAGLAKGKWTTMTDVQRAAITALAGRDILEGAAKTGSGKTLAFLVPLLELLFRERWSKADGLGALVVSPTRELALQIFDVLRTLGVQHDLSAGLVIGGKDRHEEAQRIRGMNVLVATPGRLLQHLGETVGFEATNLQLLVLDEADRILDLGFEATLTAILSSLPRSRVTWLFSATQTRARLGALAALAPHAAAARRARAQRDGDAEALRAPRADDDAAPEARHAVGPSRRRRLKAKTIVFLSSCKQVQYFHAAFSACAPASRSSASTAARSRCRCRAILRNSAQLCATPAQLCAILRLSHAESLRAMQRLAMYTHFCQSPTPSSSPPTSPRAASTSPASSGWCRPTAPRTSPPTSTAPAEPRGTRPRDARCSCCSPRRRRW